MLLDRRFAILDECSTAITSETERQLYALCKDRGITFITIAHRPVLRACKLQHGDVVAFCLYAAFG